MTGGNKVKSDRTPGHRDTGYEIKILHESNTRGEWIFHQPSTGREFIVIYNGRHRQQPAASPLNFHNLFNLYNPARAAIVFIFCRSDQRVRHAELASFHIQSFPRVSYVAHVNCERWNDFNSEQKCVCVCGLTSFRLICSWDLLYLHRMHCGLPGAWHLRAYITSRTETENEIYSNNFHSYFVFGFDDSARCRAFDAVYGNCLKWKWRDRIKQQYPISRATTTTWVDRGWMANEAFHLLQNFALQPFGCQQRCRLQCFRSFHWIFFCCCFGEAMSCTTQYTAVLLCVRGAHWNGNNVFVFVNTKAFHME